jgi:hypothetical protein
MPEISSIIFQAAEFLTGKPFEIISNYFKTKKEEKIALVELMSNACFDTQLEINKLKKNKPITEEKQREISRLWSKICSQLVVAYPPLAAQFNAKAVSWANVEDWKEQDFAMAENNLKTINDFIQKLGK